MTDRLSGVYVIFDEDIRADDADHIIAAIRMIRHVQSVESHVADFGEAIAQSRVRYELLAKVIELLKS